MNLGFNLWYALPTNKAPSAVAVPSYTYPALVERVIDGDTIWVIIDAGFKIKLREKLRFRGINTPEPPTSEGERAKRFVARRLPQGASIVVFTDRSDKYDRYVADIFYLPNVTNYDRILHKGTFLNQELLDKGLAEKYR